LRARAGEGRWLRGRGFLAGGLSATVPRASVDVVPRATIIGISGPILLPEEADLLSAFPPAGVILFSRNVQDPEQLQRLMAALRAVLPADADLMVDQEGGRVARLRPPRWRLHPPAAAIGTLFERDEAAGLRAAWLTGALIGEECRRAGFTVVAAPVLDLAIPGASDAIGDRALAAHSDSVARLGREVAAGLLAAGIIPVGKHIPGHGRAIVDSHLVLPVVSDDLLEADIQPFAANVDLPWMMTAHIVYQALDASLPATLSARVIDEVIRGRIGYKGVLVTDDLAMKALSGQGFGGDPAGLARWALAAGCDIALYCAGDFAANEALLRTCPELTESVRHRLRAAHTLAADRLTSLDPDALANERARLSG
jgi:beta-N-acetylhexosaminidase